MKLHYRNENVTVKCAKLKVGFPYRYLRLMSTLTIIYNICLLAFTAEMFNFSLHVKCHIGDYLHMIHGRGNYLVAILVVTALFCIPVHIGTAFIVFKVFHSYEKKYWYYLLLAAMIGTLAILVALVLLMVVVLVHAYDSNLKGKDILLDSMKNYSSDGSTKTRIDLLQIELQCCGSLKYTDWYDIEWFDRSFIEKTDVTIVGETPFSCCSIQAQHPCIHHGVQSGFGAYKYTPENNFSLAVEGCFSVINKRKTTTSWQTVGYLAALVGLLLVGWIPLRFLQTASNEFKGFPRENYIYTGWLIGVYEVAKRDQTSSTHR